MHSRRTDLLEWIAEGRIEADRLPAALLAAGVTPTAPQWRGFIDNLMLWLGAICCALAVIFFFAYNWQALGHYARFGMVEVLLAGTLAACWRLGLERSAGRAALLAASLLVGALLALVGQTFQTGADTYELFAVWALAILPWTVVARFGPLWLFWIVLLNLAIALYFQAFGNLFGLVFGPRELAWALFVFDTAAWLAWECGARRYTWLAPRWAPRILAVASGTLVTTLAVLSVFDSDAQGALAWLAYVVWLAAVYAWFRRRAQDVFVLAGFALSLIVALTVMLSHALLSHADSFSFLLIGLVVIGMSAAAGAWLKRIAAEARA